tara:strand:+ start:7 stop:1551 length:1545 start_codon:yes stop_codon:yes gene_type:complete
MADKSVLEMEIKSNTGEVTKDVEKLDKATNSAAGGFGKIGGAIKGIGTALKAAGIGLLVGLFAKLMEVFSKNQRVLDLFNTGMTALSLAFNDLFGYIESNVGAITGFFDDLFTNPAEKIKEMATAVKEGLIDRFNEFVEVLGLAGKALGQLVTGKFSEAFETIKQAGKESIDVITGVDKSFEKVAESVTNYTKTLLENAKATTTAQNAARLAEAQLQGLIEKNDLLAETQRQIRDDETKTFAERIAANQELGRVLDQQEVDMLKLADARILAAKLELDANKTNIDLQVAYQQTLNDRAGVEAQIAGFRSEQLTNEVSLNKELLEIQNELTAAGLTGIELELAELEAAYKIKLDLARKAGEETTAIDAQYAKQRGDIVREGINTQLEAYSGLAGALGALAGESKELAVAQAVIDTYVGANKAFAQGGTVGFVTAAAVIAAGLANVQKILSTPIPNGGGGGGTAPVESQAPAPQMMSGAFDLSGGVQPDAMRAYVVTDEMTNSQNQLANIRRRSTI